MLWKIGNCPFSIFYFKILLIYGIMLKSLGNAEDLAMMDAVGKLEFGKFYII